MEDIELRPPREARNPAHEANIDSPILKPTTQPAIMREEASSIRTSFDSEIDERQMAADRRTPSPCTEEDLASTRSSSDTAAVDVAETTKPPRAIVRPTTEWYSDLEVVASIPNAYDTHDKMTVIHDVSSEKIITYGDSHPMTPMSPSAVDPVPAYPSSIAGAPLATKGDDNYAEWEQSRSMSTSKPRRTCCGMTTRTLSYLIIGLMATILILLAIILGTTLTMKKSKGSGNADGSDTVGILSNSKLAAVNWTDPDGLVDRAAVFYQHTSNSLMVSIRDSVSNVWTTTNLTEQLLNSTGAAVLDVLPGTPLAAVTQRYQVSLYYLTTSFEVAETWAYTSNVGAGQFPGWSSGSLATSLKPPGAMNGSSLAAEWMICTNCTNSLLVTWQGENGDVQMANLTENSWYLNDAISPTDSSFLGGTALALKSQMGNATLFGTDPNAARLFAFNSDGLLDLTNGPVSNFSSWDEDVASMSRLLTNQTPPKREKKLNADHFADTAVSETAEDDSTPALAAISYGTNGWANSMVNYLAPNGTIITSIFDGTTWTSGLPTISDNAGAMNMPNFTNIAATQEMRVYALSNGTIYEYIVDETDPLSWKAGSKVVSY